MRICREECQIIEDSLNECLQFCCLKSGETCLVTMRCGPYNVASFFVFFSLNWSLPCEITNLLVEKLMPMFIVWDQNHPPSTWGHSLNTNSGFGCENFNGLRGVSALHNLVNILILLINSVHWSYSINLVESGLTRFQCIVRTICNWILVEIMWFSIKNPVAGKFQIYRHARSYITKISTLIISK